MNKDPYHLFFDFYNRHYDHALKDTFIDLIKKTFKNKNLIECGCGPAHIAIELNKMGYHVIASDISQDFLKMAKENAALENIPLKTLHHNVLNPFIDRYDGVIMVFDVINHLETLNDFDKAITNIYNGLNPNGVFIMDSLRCDYIKKMIDYDEWLENDGETLHWTISEGPHKCSFRHRLRRNDRVSTLNQRSFDLKTMRSLFSRFTLLNQIRLEDRDIFILKK